MNLKSVYDQIKKIYFCKSYLCILYNMQFNIDSYQIKAVQSDTYFYLHKIDINLSKGYLFNFFQDGQDT